ncbi:hypothetical protein FJT64_019101 [Amphibalanus amphitrite]|uniref:Uncharacterized protein n=1 Tax=Amphibalanus amphitrite TaxID=1232801 RepID=A0A6A4WSR5_AMPAM|nr:hypothetical protein FJT64_019101 [Amphibalanus amphitrite]
MRAASLHAVGICPHSDNVSSSLDKIEQYLRLQHNVAIDREDLSPPPSIQISAANLQPMRCTGTFEVFISLQDRLIRDTVYVFTESRGMLLAWYTAKSLAILPDHYPQPGMPIASRQWRHHRLSLGWRHRTTADIVRVRYLTGAEVRLNVHTELSNLHLLGFLVASEDMSEEDHTGLEDCSYHKVLQALRLADGLWYHLMCSGQ